MIFPYVLLDPEMRRRMKTDGRPEEVIDWKPGMGFKPALHLRASSWPYEPLFDIPPVTFDCSDEGLLWAPEDLRTHPAGHWGYRNVILPAGEPLSTMCGARRGRVWFDGPVVIPALFRGHPRRVWMSHTPMEAFTLRGGVKAAKGRVIVGGLGLGWQLREIAKKKSVTEITVYEREPSLCSWFGERMVSELSEQVGKPVRLICADAYKADFDNCDSVIFDIWPGYREAHYDRAWRTLKKNLEPRGLKVWAWGDVK